jgi:hypothetical protein
VSQSEEGIGGLSRFDDNEYLNFLLVFFFGAPSREGQPLH